ncbi:MAG: Uma2 family endonuclease [Chloroflexi bacterium]|nr:Uma2 family endonuclease [Chloroflexota bacterium]
MTTQITYDEPESLRTAGWFVGERTPAPVRLDFRPILELLSGLSDYELDDWWIRFNRANKDNIGNLEINSEGALLISPFPGWDGSQAQGDFGFDLGQWSKGYGGQAGGFNLGVRLPNGSRYGPDVCWISGDQLGRIETGLDHILLFCPAFVAELRTPVDDLRVMRLKMAEYVANGAQLGWLIDPANRQVHIYRPDAAPEVLDNPETVSGDPVLPGFVFEARKRIFDLQW